MGNLSNEVEKLKKSCLKHDQVTEIHEWISYVSAKYPSDRNPRLCRLSLFPFQAFRVYTISDITENVTSMSVASAASLLITPDVINQRERRVDLSSILNDISPVVLVSNHLLGSIIGLQFDWRNTLSIDADSLVNRLTPHLTIRSVNISHIPSVNPLPKSAPLFHNAVSELKMETASSEYSISYLTTSTASRLDQIRTSVEDLRSTVQESSQKMGFLNEEIFRTNLGIELGAKRAERVQFESLGDLVREVGRRMQKTDAEIDNALGSIIKMMIIGFRSYRHAGDDTVDFMDVHFLSDDPDIF